MGCFSRVWERCFGNGSSAKPAKSLKSRSLCMESLEDRSLLSVSPGGIEASIAPANSWAAAVQLASAYAKPISGSAYAGKVMELASVKGLSGLDLSESFLSPHVHAAGQEGAVQLEFNLVNFSYYTNFKVDAAEGNVCLYGIAANGKAEYLAAVDAQIGTVTGLLIYSNDVARTVTITENALLAAGRIDYIGGNLKNDTVIVTGSDEVSEYFMMSRQTREEQVYTRAGVAPKRVARSVDMITLSVDGGATANAVLSVSGVRDIELNSGAGDELFMFNDKLGATYHLVAGAGQDTISFANAEKGVKLDMGKLTAQSVLSGKICLKGDIECVVGSRQNDTIITAANTVLVLGGDVNAGSTGADCIIVNGNALTQTSIYLNGKAQKVSAKGAGGDYDVQIANGDRSKVDLSAVKVGSARVLIDGNNVRAIGTYGHDALLVNGNFAEVRGESGNDVIMVKGANAKGSGDAGNDIINFSLTTGKTVIDGGADNDVLVGGDGNDQIKSVSGRNIMIGGLGSNNIRGGRDADFMIARSTGGLDYLIAQGGATIDAYAELGQLWRDNKRTELLAILGAPTSSDVTGKIDRGDKVVLSSGGGKDNILYACLSQDNVSVNYKVDSGDILIEDDRQLGKLVEPGRVIEGEAVNPAQAREGSLTLSSQGQTMTLSEDAAYLPLWNVFEFPFTIQRVITLSSDQSDQSVTEGTPHIYYIIARLRPTIVADLAWASSSETATDPEATIISEQPVTKEHVGISIRGMLPYSETRGIMTDTKMSSDAANWQRSISVYVDTLVTGIVVGKETIGAVQVSAPAIYKLRRELLSAETSSSLIDQYEEITDVNPGEFVSVGGSPTGAGTVLLSGSVGYQLPYNLYVSAFASEAQSRPVVVALGGASFPTPVRYPQGAEKQLLNAALTEGVDDVAGRHLNNMMPILVAAANPQGITHGVIAQKYAEVEDIYTKYVFTYPIDGGGYYTSVDSQQDLSDWRDGIVITWSWRDMPDIVLMIAQQPADTLTELKDALACNFSWTVSCYHNAALAGISEQVEAEADRVYAVVANGSTLYSDCEYVTIGQVGITDVSSLLIAGDGTAAMDIDRAHMTLNQDLLATTAPFLQKYFYAPMTIYAGRVVDSLTGVLSKESVGYNVGEGEIIVLNDPCFERMLVGQPKIKKFGYTPAFVTADYAHPKEFWLRSPGMSGLSLASGHAGVTVLPLGLDSEAEAGVGTSVLFTIREQCDRVFYVDFALSSSGAAELGGEYDIAMSSPSFGMAFARAGRYALTQANGASMGGQAIAIIGEAAQSGHISPEPYYLPNDADQTFAVVDSIHWVRDDADRTFAVVGTPRGRSVAGEFLVSAVRERTDNYWVVDCAVDQIVVAASSGTDEAGVAERELGSTIAIVAANISAEQFIGSAPTLLGWTAEEIDAEARAAGKDSLREFVYVAGMSAGGLGLGEAGEVLSYTEGLLHAGATELLIAGAPAREVYFARFAPAALEAARHPVSVGDVVSGGYAIKRDHLLAEDDAVSQDSSTGMKWIFQIGVVVDGAAFVDSFATGATVESKFPTEDIYAIRIGFIPTAASDVLGLAMPGMPEEFALSSLATGMTMTLYGAEAVTPVAMARYMPGKAFLLSEAAEANRGSSKLDLATGVIIGQGLAFGGAFVSGADAPNFALVIRGEAETVGTSVLAITHREELCQIYPAVDPLDVSVLARLPLTYVIKHNAEKLRSDVPAVTEYMSPAGSSPQFAQLLSKDAVDAVIKVVRESGAPGVTDLSRVYEPTQRVSDASLSVVVQQWSIGPKPVIITSGSSGETRLVGEFLIISDLLPTGDTLATGDVIYSVATGGFTPFALILGSDVALSEVRVLTQSVDLSDLEEMSACIVSPMSGSLLIYGSHGCPGTLVPILAAALDELLPASEDFEQMHEYEPLASDTDTLLASGRAGVSFDTELYAQSMAELLPMSDVMVLTQKPEESPVFGASGSDASGPRKEMEAALAALMRAKP